MLARLFGVFVVVVVVEWAPARAGASVWCVLCCGGCRVSERHLVLARLFGVFVVVAVGESAPARAGTSVWRVRCYGGCRVSASSCWRVCLVCSLLWWL